MLTYNVFTGVAVAEGMVERRGLCVGLVVAPLKII